MSHVLSFSGQPNKFSCPHMQISLIGIPCTAPLMVASLEVISYLDFLTFSIFSFKNFVLQLHPLRINNTRPPSYELPAFLNISWNVQLVVLSLHRRPSNLQRMGNSQPFGPKHIFEAPLFNCCSILESLFTNQIFVVMAASIVGRSIPMRWWVNQQKKSCIFGSVGTKIPLGVLLNIFCTSDLKQNGLQKHSSTTHYFHLTR